MSLESLPRFDQVTLLTAESKKQSTGRQRIGEQPSLEIDGTLVPSIESFELPKPHSVRTLEHTLRERSAEKSSDLLLRIMTTFSCEACWKNSALALSYELSAIGSSSETTLPPARGVDLAVQVTHTGLWRIVLAPAALEHLQVFGRSCKAPQNVRRCH